MSMITDDSKLQDQITDDQHKALADSICKQLAQTLIEYQTGFNKSIENLHDDLKISLSDIRNNLSDVKNDVKGIKNKIDDINDRLENVEKILEGHDSDILKLKRYSSIENTIIRITIAVAIAVAACALIL
jgi:predicted  nucleic acid-binding Zn-ribbon protein